MKCKLIAAVDNFKGVRIAVVGDLMLDVYLWGRVTRISPEAPVPIVRMNRESHCLGGAANVMRNIITLGGNASAFGMIGEDEDGKELKAQLASYGINDDSVKIDKGRKTTKKQRIISGTQQLLRVDYEDTHKASDAISKEITKNILDLIEADAVDAIIFEDYAKGMLSYEMLNTIVPAANKKNIITSLDPKPGTMPPVKGLTVIKPNRKEALALANATGAFPNPVPLNELDRIAEKIREDWEPKYLLISLASEGMALYGPNGGRIMIPTRAKEVFDVSGAGDTVVATFTLAISSGLSPREAAEIANYAAGIVVGKVGTVTVSAEELKLELAQNFVKKEFSE